MGRGIASTTRKAPESSRPSQYPKPRASLLFKSHLASTKVAGLAPETTYYLRLVAKDSDGNQTVGPEGAPFTTLQPLEILATWATEVGTDAARLHAEVNPRESATDGYFEYVDDATYQADLQAGGPGHGFEHAVKAPDVSGAAAPLNFGAGDVPKTVTLQLYPLSRGIYHYRLIARDHCKPNPEVVCSFGSEEHVFTVLARPGEAKTDCPNQAFRFGPSANLPDCRAYEMVSPLDKNNSDLALAHDEVPDQSSRDGEAVTFATKAAAFAEPAGAPFVTQYVSIRDAERGWGTRSITASRTTKFLYFGEGFTSPFKLFSEDLCSAWMIQDTAVTLAPAAPAGFPGLYRRENCGEDPSWEPIAPVAPPGFDPPLEREASRYFPVIQGASADASVSVFRADAALTEDAFGEAGIYQTYLSKEGRLRLVSALPSGKAAKTHTTVGTVQGDGPLEFRNDNVYRAVSTDGSRVFWTATKDADPVVNQTETQKGDEPGALYLRVNAAEEQSKVSAGKCTEPELACTLRVSELVTPEPVRFWSADTAGTRAIFTVQAGPLAGNLYEFSVDESEGTLKAKATLIAESVDGVMGASEDASRVYFASTEVLSEAENSEGEKAQAGRPNLYLHESGEAATFIATLSGLDMFTEASIAEPPSPLAQFPYKRTSRVSPDGLHAAFTSAASLTGYDNVDAASGQPDTEVYVYDASAGELACVSCNPSGSRPIGREISKTNNGKTRSGPPRGSPGWSTQQHPSRALSDDGQRLFFESFDALLPRDTNGRQDVYEWQRAEDEEQCEAQLGGELFLPDGGCLSLISSGQSAGDSEFVDAGADGRDVFILTASSLLPADPAFTDIYDARVGGGFPAPPSAPPACEGEACQGPSSPPDDPTPASAAFQGAGNVDEPAGRCAKGKTRRKGRCVSRKRRNAAKHAKHRNSNRNRGAQR